MVFNDLEDVVREDLAGLNELLSRSNGKKEAITLYHEEGDCFYNLLAKGKVFAYGTIEEINVTVKALYSLAEHPARYNMTVRVY